MSERRLTTNEEAESLRRNDGYPIPAFLARLLSTRTALMGRLALTPKCGEHRGEPQGRTWCCDCHEWCYGTLPCRGCADRALLAELHGEALDEPQSDLPEMGEPETNGWGISETWARLSRLCGHDYVRCEKPHTLCCACAAAWFKPRHPSVGAQYDPAGGTSA